MSASTETDREDGAESVLGVLGGSGLYDLDGLADVRELTLTTPFGEPSGPLVTGTVGGARLVFLPRHGRGHRLLPSEINYRANVHAFRQLGVQRVLSVSAVGSLREGMEPGDLVLVDQFIDKTFRRPSTFFGDGVVGHVSFADPVCADLVGLVAETAVSLGFPSAAADDRRRVATAGRGRRLHRGGTYVCMEGPQFSTRAESDLHRSWSADTIGMTAATEAKLCREAELCFASLALVTDFDCWHAEEEAVTASAVVEVLRANVQRAKDIVRGVLPKLAAHPRACACGRAAQNAIMTSREAIPASARERLRALYGRYL
ncbi:MAG TPA: S-methyl-5'-thioadenosine phosphorylase [Polyangia bacterium]|jgi:5'-methylthioadenosine phosphorylase